MIVLLVFLFIFIFLLSGYIVFNCNTNADPGDIGLVLLLCILFSIVCGGLIDIQCQSSEPTAMDVYRGNTTLEITYRDSIPVDSVVVFKSK